MSTPNERATANAAPSSTAPSMRRSAATVVVRDATAADLPRILEIARRCSEPRADGFLVSGYSRSDYKRFLAIAVDFLCCDDDTVSAFAFLMRRCDLPPSDGSNRAARYAAMPDLIVKQVAVDPDARRRGLGSVLYGELIQRHRGRPIGAGVVPENTASGAFHERMGFLRAVTLRDGESGDRDLWVRGAPVSGLARAAPPPG